MTLSIGIVGLPNVGKSTLFNALTNAQSAQAANYPFCTIEPNKATVAVPDNRLEDLAAKVSPQKTIHASVDFIDIAGLVKGASKGEGLGNQFLANIRECSVIVHVIRAYEDENVAHVSGEVNPQNDIDTIETELLLADIQAVEKRLEKLQKQSKGNRDARILVDALSSLFAHLNSGSPASQFSRPDSEDFSRIWHELSLLSAKPVIYCANVDDASMAEGNEYSREIQKIASKRDCGFAIVCAKLEEELQGLSHAEQLEMLSAYGIPESGLSRIIRTGYNLLGLQSFFTAGPDEVRAWTIRQGCKAPMAAGVIHTDFEKGFIRAEVISYDDYMSYANESACRAAGVLRTEGKDYEVHDGDVIHFLFNV